MTQLKDSMSNIEKIRQEIKRRMEELERDKYINIDAKACRQSELGYLERFIDSLPEEKPSEDLEEAAEEYADKHGFRVPYDGSNNYYDDVDVKASKEGFIAGAEWQKEQMMKEAVDYKIVNNLAAYPVIYYEVNHLGLKYGDKVKIIIVKKNEEET